MPATVRRGPSLDEHLPSKAEKRDGQLWEPGSSRLLYQDFSAFLGFILMTGLTRTATSITRSGIDTQRPSGITSSTWSLVLHAAFSLLGGVHTCSLPEKKPLSGAPPSRQRYGQSSGYDVSREGRRPTRVNDASSRSTAALCSAAVKELAQTELTEHRAAVEVPRCSRIPVSAPLEIQKVI